MQCSSVENIVRYIYKQNLRKILYATFVIISKKKIRIACTNNSNEKRLQTKYRQKVRTEINNDDYQRVNSILKNKSSRTSESLLSRCQSHIGGRRGRGRGRGQGRGRGRDRGRDSGYRLLRAVKGVLERKEECQKNSPRKREKEQVSVQRHRNEIKTTQ